jgi:hypothetical protein
LYVLLLSELVELFELLLSEGCLLIPLSFQVSLEHLHSTLQYGHLLIVASLVEVCFLFGPLTRHLDLGDLELKVILQLLAFINLFLELSLSVLKQSLSLLKTQFYLVKLCLKTLVLLSELDFSEFLIRRAFALASDAFYEVIETILNGALGRAVHLQGILNIPKLLSHIILFTC